MEFVYGVFDCENKTNIDNDKPMYKGSYYQCQKFINATVGFDAFIGGSNWTKYQIFKIDIRR